MQRQNFLDIFRDAQCTVNEQTTFLATKVWLAVHSERRSGLAAVWRVLDELIVKSDASGSTTAAPLNCSTLVSLVEAARDMKEIRFVEKLALERHIPIAGGLCVALVRASLALSDVSHAQEIVREAGIRLSSDIWAEVITAFDRAGHTGTAMQLLFHQEQSWSLPSRSACTRMLLAIARKPRATVTPPVPSVPATIAELGKTIDDVSRASPNAIQMLMVRARYPYTARTINALVEANAAAVWTSSVGLQLTYAQDRNFRLSHSSFLRAIEANFRVGNLGAALVLWRLYAQTYPQLHGKHLERSVTNFLASLGTLHQLRAFASRYFSSEAEDAAPVVEWRWRADNVAEQDSLALFCETVARIVRTKPSTVKTYALQHFVVDRDDSLPLDFAGAYKRFQKLHHGGRRSAHAKDNLRSRLQHPVVDLNAELPANE
jgi:hypothetical protein